MRFWRTWIATSIVAANAFLQPAAADYPDRPITLIVPYAAGGSSDIVGRLFAERLERQLGQPLVIENVGGAGGSVGAHRVATAKPDGYTLLIGSGSEVLIRQILQPTPYDGLKDLTAISMIGTGPMVVIGKPALPATSLADVVALAQAKPDTLSYGSAGAGTFMHLAGEAIKFRTKTKISHVAYRGAAPVLTDVIAGHIDLGVASLASALPFIQAGQAKAFAVSSRGRSEFAPQVPPLSDFQGLAGFDLELWIGFFGPAKMPDEITTKLRTAALKVLDDAELKKKLADQAIAIRKLSGSELATFLSTENDKYRTIIKDGDIKMQ